ncbi:hypothetical protein PFFVO_02280 [Plasmodium falciparum Vietnam Oak-Knoll (FVO)]|uniref:Uncharacterized protein n=1 Tax=Plasmodium falciparum Vietnam Oak-Knoll (FVO) TaxID=1036723 RepID=A0A024V8J0_PLAFA|nr:hypothetical protein PFFVO_02280 [Plasmodium falciparum Vietnam Oak-Knoll (FVO)]
MCIEIVVAKYKKKKKKKKKVKDYIFLYSYKKIPNICINESISYDDDDDSMNEKKHFLSISTINNLRILFHKLVHTLLECIKVGVDIGLIFVFLTYVRIARVIKQGMDIIELYSSFN